MFYIIAALSERPDWEAQILVVLQKLFKAFRKAFKKSVERYYIMYLPDFDAIEDITRQDFKQLHSIHWGIECASQSCTLRLRCCCNIFDFSDIL